MGASSLELKTYRIQQEFILQLCRRTHCFLAEVGIRGCEVIKGVNKNPSCRRIFVVSAEGVEYHPPCEGQQQKILRKGGFSVSAEGIEPSTNGLKGRCSAIELRAHHKGGLHSIMGKFQRQRKTLMDKCVLLSGGTNG
jgi:hypothetical protein